jgi:hypothetical protein
MRTGVGVLLTRLGEGGKFNKGPSGMGLRVQDTMRVGPLKVGSHTHTQVVPGLNMPSSDASVHKADWFGGVFLYWPRIAD